MQEILSVGQSRTSWGRCAIHKPVGYAAYLLRRRLGRGEFVGFVVVGQRIFDRVPGLEDMTSPAVGAGQFRIAINGSV